jgi:hypothetical protein
MTEQDLSFEELVAYASGELTGADAERIEARVEGSGAVTRLRRIFELLRTDDSAAPPAEVRRRVMAAFGEIARPSRPWLEGLQQLVARLILDTRDQVAVAAYRGGTSSYRMAFDSPCGRIDLQVLPPAPSASDRWRLRGEAAFDETRPTTVSLVAGEASEPAATASADEQGHFNIESPPGVYDLLIELETADQVVVAPGLEIGSDVG